MIERNEMDAACDVIEQLMVACEKCGKIARGARWLMPADVEIVICEECNADRDGLEEWFVEQMRIALRESGEYDELPDGRWRRHVPMAESGAEQIPVEG